jgi:hypothetical protein
MEMRAQDIQFVIGAEGKPTAVLIDIATWERILDALEDAEDIVLAKSVLATIDAVNGDLEKAGLLNWDEVRADLERQDDPDLIIDDAPIIIGVRVRPPYNYEDIENLIKEAE